MTLYLGNKQIASGGLKADMLNNPFTLLESKYSEVEIVNSSWLKSNGQWNSQSLYPQAYAKALSIGKKTTEEYTDYDFVVDTTSKTFRLPLKTVAKIY